MKLNLNKLLKPLAFAAGAIILLASCNKDVPAAEPATTAASSASSVMDIINSDPTFTFLKAAIARATTGTASPSLTVLLSDRTAVYTVFAPTDAAFQLSGFPVVAAINTLRPGQLDTLIRYHIVGGQKLSGAAIPSTFPNLQLPSLFALAAPSASLPPGLRMSLFPSKRGTAFWVNNVPLTATDIDAANGVIHKTATIVGPPSQYLWDRINTDANLTYLKAAVLRADSGSTAATSLMAALQNPAANLTVFAPSDAAFKAALTGQITLALIPVVTAQLIAGGATPAQAAAQAPAIAQANATALAASPTVFSNPALYGSLSAQTVQGLLVYHILGVRAFTVNFPTTATLTKTLLNSAIPTHPGVSLQATFGPTGVTAATVQGFVNPTPSNLAINPTPAPGGTSDQHYINGVLHVIDQALRPQ